jgi:two-component system response regulator ResD
MASVLIVESDPAVRRLLVDRFTREEYRVVADVESFSAADLTALGPDLLVLNVAGNGDLEPLPLLRSRSSVPTVVLLSQAGDHDAASALDAGADDVLCKPLSMRDLMARCRAVLRRSGTVGTRPLLEYTGLVIDRSTRLVTIEGGHSVELPHREFDLLVYLAASPGQVFSRDQILEHVWGSSGAWQDTATVTEHIYRLRRHLGPIGGCCISTVRSVGYRFIPPAHPRCCRGRPAPPR